MAKKSPSQFHAHWGQVASPSEIPNVAAASIQDAAVDRGDSVYSLSDNALYVCKDETVGAAVWEEVGAGASGTTIKQALNEEVTGTTYENVGSVYLTAGTLQAPARLFMGATTVGPDAAEVELRRETGGALVASWTATGLLQEAVQGVGVTIPADDWYNIRLRGNNGGVIAKIKGLDWTVV